MLTNRVLRAQEALDWGLVNQVVPDDQLADATKQLVTTLASGATGAFGATKKLLISSANESLESQLELEARSISDASRTDDAKEGIQAFFDKRAAKFSGS
jgi:2-(1,2-epoxy-1,2-dihydrophenyl)acetyl-CoA isomerase